MLVAAVVWIEPEDIMPPKVLLWNSLHPVRNHADCGLSEIVCEATEQLGPCSNVALIPLH